MAQSTATENDRLTGAQNHIVLPGPDFAGQCLARIEADFVAATHTEGVKFRAQRPVERVSMPFDGD